MSSRPAEDDAPALGAPAHGVLLTVAYDGRPFAGFARQPTARTVAGELDGAVRAIDARASLVRGASRTDAGVHARGQRVAFDTTRVLEARNWVLGLNAHLPAELAVTRAARVAAGYEPRFRATRKTYRYVVLESRVRDPFWDGRAFRVGEPLDREQMASAAGALAGEHDFAAFRAASDERTNTLRNLFRIDVRRAPGDERLLEIVVEGNGFLHRMMRIIAGSLVDIGRGRLEPNALERALESGDRRALGITAPADGLYLDSVELDDEGHDAWPDRP